MSKFRQKLAEQYVDPETGEILDKAPENNNNKSFEDRMRNIMYDTQKRVRDVYRDPKYCNQWDKVSPFNILVSDNINQLYAMDPETAKNTIINIIEQLNKTYGNDKSYDYISKEYLNKIKLNLSKKKTIDKIVEYLTNIYFQGMGMGNNNKERYASVDSLQNLGYEKINIVTIEQYAYKGSSNVVIEYRTSNKNPRGTWTYFGGSVWDTPPTFNSLEELEDHIKNKK